jgi:hypothetical protein
MKKSLGAQSLVIKCSVFFLVLLSCIELKAQSGGYLNWVHVNSARGDFSFKMPSQPNYIDSLRTLYYNLEVDSSMAMHVHYTDSAYLEHGNPFIDSLLAVADGDILRLFAKIMLMTTNAECTSVTNMFLKNGKKGLELGMKQNAEGINVFSFSALFYTGKRFYAFTVSAEEKDLVKLMAYKTKFFNSIMIN